jgi:hypothetical protein
MKKINLILVLLAIMLCSIYSQVPQSFNYQATLRDHDGQILSQKTVSIRISILKDNPPGISVYTETHSVATTSQGIINLRVGTGISSDTFENINWSEDTYYMKIELDPAGGNDFSVMGINELSSVPYALSAKEAGKVDWQNIQNMPDIIKAADSLFADLHENFRIPYADSISDGFLKKEDWIKFNNKNVSQWNISGQNIHYDLGNVGIGTGDPQNALSIVRNEDEWPGRIMLSIKNTSTGPKSLAYLKIYAGPGETGTALGHVSTTYLANESPEDVAGFGILASSENGMIINATKPDLSPGVIKFFNGQTSGTKFIETMRINSNGNVGIGTRDPIGKLNIVGSVESGEERAFIRLKNNATGPTSSVSIALQAFDDKGVSFAYTSRYYTLNDLADFGVFTTSGRGIALAANHGQIRFYTSINPDNTYSEKMRITEEGNVGMGTTVPRAKVEIADGDIYISSLNKGIIMTSPDGQCWRGTLNNSGVLEFSPVPCP